MTFEQLDELERLEKASRPLDKMPPNPQAMEEAAIFLDACRHQLAAHGLGLLPELIRLARKGLEAEGREK